MSDSNQKTEQGFAFFRMEVIKKVKVADAIKHNRRAIPAELDGKHDIDPDRVHLNYHLHGRATAEDVQYEWNGFYSDIILGSPNPPRKDAVWLNEIVISVSAYDELASDPLRLRAYFMDACDWINLQFPNNMISFDVHLDQAHPHAHALILPVLNGKMDGSKINKPFNQARLRKLFAKEVGAKYGYKSNVERLSPMQKDDMYQSVIKELTHNVIHAGIVNHALWETVRDNIRADPRPYFQSLGLELKESFQAPKGVRHIVDISRSKGKGSFIK